MSILSQLTNRFLNLSAPLQLLIWLIAILVIKFDTLIAPPVWDTAMGVFPPAIFLYENNFNILELVQLPGWWQGGPNVHSLSLWTWLIAIVMTITQNAQATFFIIHSITFLLCAYAISTLVRTLVLMDIKPYLAILAGLTLLLTPMVLVQIGYMYTEAPVMALSVLAWASWYHHREGQAVALAVIAISIKATGLIIGLCLMPLLIFRLIDSFTKKRLILLISIPIFYYAHSALFGWLGGKNNVPDMPWGNSEVVMNGLFSRVNYAIDLKSLVGAGIIASILYILYHWYQSKKIIPLHQFYQTCLKDGTPFIAICYLFVFILGIFYSTFQGDLFLYRYIAPMIPFTIITLTLIALSLRIQGIMATIAFFACCVSIYNHNGALYNPSGAFSMVESSHAYKDYLLAQKTIIDQIQELNDETPIYVSREIDYMTSSPMMGYLDPLKPNVFGFYKDEYSGMYIEDFPPEYYVALTNGSHGGVRLSWAIRKAREAADKGWLVEPIAGQIIGGIPMTIHRMYNPALLN